MSDELEKVRKLTAVGLRIDYTTPSGEVVYSRYACIFPKGPWRIVTIAGLATVITLLSSPIWLAVLGR